MRNLYSKHNLCDQPPINMVLNRSLGFRSQELFHPAVREPNYIQGRLSSAGPAQHRTPDRAALAWVTGEATREITSEACSPSSSKAGERIAVSGQPGLVRSYFKNNEDSSQCYNYFLSTFQIARL